MELIRPFKFGADYSSNSIGFSQTRCTSSPEDCHTRPVAQCRQFQEGATDASVSECTWTLSALEAFVMRYINLRLTYLLTYLSLPMDDCSTSRVRQIRGDRRRTSPCDLSPIALRSVAIRQRQARPRAVVGVPAWRA